MGGSQGVHVIDRADVHSTRESDDKDVPACQSCRKRKLKCSRETPTCSECVRLNASCQYDHNKQKPGIKTGVIETLSRRLELLESLLLDAQGKPKSGPVPTDQPGCVYHASLLLARELQVNVENSGKRFMSGTEALAGPSRRNCLQETEFVFGPGEQQTFSGGRTLKKRKIDHKRPEHNLLEVNWDNAEDILPSLLPSAKVLVLVVDAFCSTVHPWIPFIHLDRFREQFNDVKRRPDLDVILHAMVFATMKYLREEDINMGQPEIARQIQLSRNVVMLTATDRLTIQNIQALIIVAFHDIGSGKISRAWPIIGSLTRTVEYLQLTVEADEMQQYSLSTPLVLLDKPEDWTESENRRRVFWNVFLLDRFCSVATGWSTSLTSDDVHRRLPCDGGLWQHRDEAVVTPYFGIWNKSAAKIGNSIAYIPAHYPSPDQPVDTTSPNGVSDFGPVDTSKLGAFAYYIEATESLSQVTTFFLQQKVDFRNRQEAGSWLTRFKELDLRLVHWKMFLPQKWKDSNISRDEAFINMDPNLTIAHTTHNTSMILLHQHIAYPPLEWKELIRLPSSCSAGTCESAAVETASISEKYLKYTEVGIVSSQFALCAFVAARILLVHWRYYQTTLLPEFFSLLSSLENMSMRWRGPHLPQQASPSSPPPLDSDLDMAGQYLYYLQALYRQCANSPEFRMDANLGGLLPPMMPQSGSSASFTLSPSLAMGSVPRYPPKMRNNNNTQSQAQPQSSYYPNQTPYTSTVPQSPTLQFQNQLQSQSQDPSKFTPSTQYPSTSSYFPSSALPASASNPSPLSGTLHHNSIMGIPNSAGLGISGEHNSMNEHGIDSLTEMSNLLLGQQFLEMDRVITLEETDFTLDLDLGAWGGS